ncbi:MAG: ribosome small subunit-dependent GTPase A, partial [Oscillospiraceae bacterium]
MIINENQGLIIKAIGGMYWIKTNTNTVICSARGSLRKNDIKPMVGDIAFFEKESTQSENGVLISIKERKNFLIRPIVSNIDNIFIISSIEKPVPNLLILDKLFAIAGFHDIKANLVITKTDLNDHSWLEDIYINSGFDVFSFSSQTNEGIDELKKAIKGKINVFIGNTGVGKSTTLNAIEEGLSLKTAEISEKLGRGRHTTRHTELFELSNGGFIADTPGFSTVDVKMYGITDKENL